MTATLLPRTKDVLQFLFWIEYYSYGKMHKEWRVCDCPENVTDIDDADEYLQRIMLDLMDELDCSTVSNFSPTEIGMNLMTPDEKAAYKKEQDIRKAELANERSLQRVYNKGLSKSEVDYNSETAVLTLSPKGLEKVELDLVAIAKSLTLEHKSEKGRFDGNPETLVTLTSDFGETVIRILDGELYRSHAAQTMIYNSESECLRDEIRQRKLQYRVTHFPESVTDKELEETLSKGHINFYRENHVGIVYNGFSITFDPSAFMKQVYKNRNLLEDIKGIKLL